MAVTVPQPANPPCDICGNEPSIMSLMNLDGSYDQIRSGAACAPVFLHQMAAQIGGEDHGLLPAEDYEEYCPACRVIHDAIVAAQAGPPAEPGPEPAGVPEPASPEPDAEPAGESGELG